MLGAIRFGEGLGRQIAGPRRMVTIWAFWGDEADIRDTDDALLTGTTKGFLTPSMKRFQHDIYVFIRTRLKTALKQKFCDSSRGVFLSNPGAKELFVCKLGGNVRTRLLPATYLWHFPLSTPCIPHLLSLSTQPGPIS